MRLPVREPEFHPPRPHVPVRPVGDVLPQHGGVFLQGGLPGRPGDGVCYSHVQHGLQGGFLGFLGGRRLGGGCGVVEAEEGGEEGGG